MASSPAKLARLTTVLENVDKFRSVKSADCDTQAPAETNQIDCKQCCAVEHLVLFNMPYLQGDQEAAILRDLYHLRFKFDKILVLIVGRTLNKVDNVTHALFMRFPNVKSLLSFYKSHARKHVQSLMVPHLYGEYVVDYTTKIGYLNMNQKAPVCVSAMFLRKNRDVCPHEMDDALQDLVTAVDDLSYMKDFTAGSNLFFSRNQLYTHACVGYVKTVDGLDRLAEDSNYNEVLDEKVLPLSDSAITVNIMEFRPLSSAL